MLPSLTQSSHRHDTSHLTHLISTRDLLIKRHLLKKDMGLPLRMNNLHAPTVPSGPTSSAAATNGVAGHLSFAELQLKKDDIEAELKALGGVLDSVRPHMPSPLSF